jgi:N-acetylglucosamine malate deacetylase 1
VTDKRILVLAPHPDDETVGCAVALRRAIAAGASGYVMYLTTGVPPRALLWPWQRPGYHRRVARRRAEAAEAARRIGLSPVAWLNHPSRTLKSHLAAALAAVADAVAAHAIDALWVSAWEGAHQDHDVANFIAAQFAARMPVLEFAEYNFAGSRVRSGCFPTSGPEDTVLRLDAEEALWKRRLLACYRSERGNLAHIRTETEALRRLPPHDYAQRPHPGRLFYERFHWVPFRHPRIDFATPEEVAAALAGAPRMRRQEKQSASIAQ